MRLGHGLVPPRPADTPDVDTFVRRYVFDELDDGTLAYTPIGTAAFGRAVAVIREEMARIDAEEIIMPALVSEEAIARSKRVKTGFFRRFGIYLDVGAAKYFMMPTNEETMALLYGTRLAGADHHAPPSFFFQIGKKYRSESDPTFPVRLNEFFMHDAYAFAHPDAFARAHEAMRQAYHRIFTRLDLEYYEMEEQRDPLFKDVSREFLAALPGGRDVFTVLDASTRSARKLEGPDAVADGRATKTGLEIAHIYDLRDLYRPFWEGGAEVQMGGYGLGIDRTLYASMAQHFQGGAMRWPRALAPFAVDLIPDGAAADAVEWLYQALREQGVPTLLDDTVATVAQKTINARTLGAPFQLLASTGGGRLFDRDGRKIAEAPLGQAARFVEAARALPG